MARARSRAKSPWRRHLRFTREGRVFVFVTVALGFAAINTGTNLMYLVFGFMLSLIVLSGILSEHALRKLRIERHPPQRSFVGEPSLFELSVHNDKKRLHSYSVEIEDMADGESTERRCYFLKIPAGGEQTSVYRRVPARRGLLRLTGFRVSTRFPFSLFEKWREVSAEADIVVYPAVAPAQLPPGNAREEGSERGAFKGRGIETRELREYRPDDERRAIHWKRSAAIGKLVVREFEQEAAAVYSLVLDNAAADPADKAFEDDFEARVSTAAGLVEGALARGFAVEICVRGARSVRLLGGVAPDPLWRFLALLEAIPASQAGELATPSRGTRVIHVEAQSEARGGGKEHAA